MQKFKEEKLQKIVINQNQAYHEANVKYYEGEYGPALQLYKRARINKGGGQLSKPQLSMAKTMINDCEEQLKKRKKYKGVIKYKGLIIKRA